MQNLEKWLSLWLTTDVGPAKFRDILRVNPNLEDPLPMFVKKNNIHVLEAMRWQEQKNNHIVRLCDKSYPPLLKKIPNPPPVLFVKGNLSVIKNPQIAIVGSRNASKDGLSLAYDFSKYFSNLGICVTSGLALGIDTASHKGALMSTHGSTIAVLASGLERIYPRSNHKLAIEISEDGALISENYLSKEPIANLFPQRNRIISGLSLGVLIVEAASKSGSLITAKYALEQNREVFAIPGSIHNPNIKGCHKLIKEGAKLVEKAEDIIEELSGLLKYAVNNKSERDENSKSQNNSRLNIPKHCEAVLDHVGYEPTSVDKIVASCNSNIELVSQRLVELELDGIINRAPGGYVRVVC